MKAKHSTKESHSTEGEKKRGQTSEEQQKQTENIQQNGNNYILTKLI